MLFELKKIVELAYSCYKSNESCVLASIVALKGSSYRKPGVKMLISESGIVSGAVSGGCVEKAIIEESQSVFNYKQAKIMIYDGRYRLGCEGILTILIENITINKTFFNDFMKEIYGRNTISCHSYFSSENTENAGYTQLKLNNEYVSINEDNMSSNAKVGNSNYQVFKHELTPIFKLIIIGGEHDAIPLSKMAQALGWLVELVVPQNHTYSIKYFQHIDKIHSVDFINLNSVPIDDYCAVVIMTHNFAKDLGYLASLTKSNAKYIGIIGNKKRKQNLLNQLMDRGIEISLEFINTIHSPAGLNIGAITAEEISISIVSEILSFTRK